MPSKTVDIVPPFHRQGNGITAIPIPGDNRLQRVAKVPPDQFDEAVESDNPPTVTALESPAGPIGGVDANGGGRRPFSWLGMRLSGTRH